MIENSCDVLIVGGGAGGTAAALAASSYGLNVVLTEEYRWLGGQLTSQAVPPDEHPWVENFGVTKTYRQFRTLVRRFYEQDYPLRDGLRGTPFNPGGGFVSGLCTTPLVAHRAINALLEPARRSGALTVKTGLVPVSVDTANGLVEAVHFRNSSSGELERIKGSVVLDCTELGDLLPLSGTEYVSGAESKSETSELHAPDEANREDVQGFTWCFAVAYDPIKEHAIDRPRDYDFWRSFQPNFYDSPWPGPLLDWTAVSPVTLAPRKFDLFEQPGQPYNSLWNYRKIVSSANLGVKVDDVTLVNWPQNDYFIKNIIDKPTDFVAAALEESKQLSLSLLYWMRHEAPRPDGGTGYPGIYLPNDLTGTGDGFAMAPYIRESRRIRALFTVTEAHVGTEMRAEEGFNTAAKFHDSVGIGSYRIDLHPTPAERNYVDISSLPFQIPLGALIPVSTRNLIAGNKNIGVTHITNGCYRLHPIEWNIGESAGHLAAYCVTEGTDPAGVYHSQKRLLDFQQRLVAAGVELAWPEEIAKIAR